MEHSSGLTADLDTDSYRVQLACNFVQSFLRQGSLMESSLLDIGPIDLACPFHDTSCKLRTRKQPTKTVEMRGHHCHFPSCLETVQCDVLDRIKREREHSL